MSPRIPPPELDHLRLAIWKAWNFAHVGRLGEGFTVLCCSLEHLEKWADHAPEWVNALRDLQRDALSAYDQSFGIHDLATEATCRGGERYPWPIEF